MTTIHTSVLNKSGTTTLLIENSDGDTFTREYWIRGAIVWPVEYGDKMIGALLVGLWDVHRQVLLVDYEREFVAIEHVISNGRLLHRGVVEDFQRCYTRYRVNGYYYSGDEALHDRHRVMVARSRQVNPHPYFSRVTLDVPAVRRWKETSRFRIQRGTMLWNDLNDFDVNPGSKPSPMVTAMATLIAGAEEYPYRPRTP